jgi:hypothetical protein
MSVIAALNAATSIYIQRRASKLVDNIFQSSPLSPHLKQIIRIDELAAATDTSFDEAELASRVINKMENSP